MYVCILPTSALSRLHFFLPKLNQGSLKVKRKNPMNAIHKRIDMKINVRIFVCTIFYHQHIHKYTYVCMYVNMYVGILVLKCIVVRFEIFICARVCLVKIFHFRRIIYVHIYTYVCLYELTSTKIKIHSVKQIFISMFVCVCVFIPAFFPFCIVFSIFKTLIHTKGGQKTAQKGSNKAEIKSA